MEPRSMVSIADTLRTTRERLSGLARHYFSDYANQTMLWKDKEEKSLRPVKPYDSSAIAFTKHCLLALQESEALVHAIDKLMQEYQAQASGIPMFAAKKAAGTFTERLVNQDQPAAEEEPWTLDLVLDVKNHLAAIVEMAKSSGLMNTAEVKKIVESLTGIQTAQLTPKQAKEYLVTHFSNVSQAVSDLMTTYFDSTRPMAPLVPEKKYETTKPIQFELLAEVPKKWDAFKPDTYLIIKGSLGKWQVIYLDSHKNSYPIERLEIDLEPLVKVLGHKSLAELKANKDDQEAIEKALVKHWNPSVQERTEWFGVLLEPIRSVMQGTQKLSELFENFAKDAQRKGIRLDPEQTNMIKRTQSVLERSVIDKGGYYLFLDDVEETPMSKSLKGIYNVLWGINEIARGFWEHPGAEAYYDAKKHVIKALSSYWKISWLKLGGDLGKYFDQLMNAMLIYGKETTFPLLAEIASKIDDAAIQHDLRSGAALQEVRPLLYALETTYIERGFTAANPLGYSPAAHEALLTKLAKAKQEEPDIGKKLTLVKMVLSQLDWFQSYLQTVAQPGTVMRTLADAIGKAPIVDTAERRAVVLLRELARLKEEMTLTAETLSLIDKLVNQLVALLPPEKRITRSATVAQIKPEEMSQLQKTLDQVNYDLTEKFHGVAKYTEAVTEHEKLRTEYAVYTLTNEGINGLIRATLAAKDNPKKNLKHKRKLAALLADFDQKDRASYLANAHLVATMFVNSPATIKTYIETIYAVAPALGHQLAIETLVAGYADYSDAIILSDSKDVAQQDLTNLLDRLEAQQFIKMLDSVAKEDKAAMSRAGLFCSLLVGGQALTDAHIIESVANIFKNKLSKRDLIDTLVAAYAVQPAEIKNKLARFMGRLTRVDAELANVVFNNKEALAILQHECLTRVSDDKSKADPALYYESLVNTFQFDYVNGKHNMENRSTTEFTNANRSNIIKMHVAMHPEDKDKPESQIIAVYHSARELVQLTDQFIRTRLSKRSVAENTLREFFSALLLTNSDEMMQMRKEIIDIQLRAKGSLTAQYIQLLTTASSTAFWNTVKVDLVSRPQQQLFERFDAEAALASDLIKNLDASKKTMLAVEIKNVFAAQKRRIETAASKIATVKADVAVRCKFAQQEMNAAEREVEKKMQEWSNRVHNIETKMDKSQAIVEIKSISTSEQKVSDSTIARVKVDNAMMLTHQISKIEIILQEYLDSRIGPLAKLAGALNYHLRNEKINLVTAKLNEIKKVRYDLQSKPDVNLDNEAKRVIQLIDDLDSSHEALLAREEGSTSKTMKTVNGKQSPDKFFHKKAGKLNLTITQIHTMLSSSQEIDPTKDDLKERIGVLKQIKSYINKLLTKYAKQPAKEQSSTLVQKQTKSKR